MEATKRIETRYGAITEANSDFGYGQVWLEDEVIMYQDGRGWKSWKTVKGFERWADKQNAMSNGVFDAIDTREPRNTNTVNSWN